MQSDLDFAMIRNVRSEALHFELQLRPPGRDGRKSSSTETGVARSLEEEWDEFAKEYEIPKDVERERLITIGRDYLMKQIPTE